MTRFFYHRRWGAILPLLTAVFLTFAGCAAKKYPVEGKVVWPDGSPAGELAEGVVIFESKDAPRSARGEIQPDGTFRLHTTTPGDGVEPGEYRVLVMQSRPPDDGQRHPPLAMHRRFEDFKTSGLEFTVEAKKNEPLLRVERREKGKR